MADHPILFSAPLVRAMLEGRKTETRRILKPQPKHCYVWQDESNGEWITSGHGEVGDDLIHLRWAPGDRLYVHEHHWSWGQWERDGFTKSGRPRYRFRHHGQRVVFERPANDAPMAYFDGGTGWAYHVGIHMPRWASRLMLLVKTVRVERLQEITENGALAEGIETTEFWREEHPPSICYAVLWNNLHRADGPDGWDANPWVTVTSYIVEKRNIDAARCE